MTTRNPPLTYRMMITILVVSWFIGATLAGAGARNMGPLAPLFYFPNGHSRLEKPPPPVR